MVEFIGRSDFQKWLEGRERIEAVTIAHRAALRVLPQLVTLLDINIARVGDAGFLSIFRASLSLRIWVEQTTRKEITGRSIAADAVAFVARSPAAARSPAYAATNAAAIADAASATANAVFTARSAAAAAAADASADAFSTNSEYAASWKAISADAALLENGLYAPNLINHPLWHGEDMPETISTNWTRFTDWMRNPVRLDENWQVWKAWYEDRLKGTPSNPALDFAISTMDDKKFWDAGAKAANTEIQRLIDEHRPSPDLPEQETAPINAGISGGKISIDPPKKLPHKADLAQLHRLLLTEAGQLDNSITDQHGNLGTLIKTIVDALGETYADTNSIIAGFYSQPLAVWAEKADEELIADTAATLKGFSKNLDKFVMRFDAWAKHVATANANANKMSAGEIEKSKETARSLLNAMRDYRELFSEKLTNATSNLLSVLGKGLSYGPETPYGFFVSIRNVLIVTIQAALNKIPAGLIREETKEAKKQLRKSARKFIYDKISTIGDLILGMSLLRPLSAAFEFLRKTKDD